MYSRSAESDAPGAPMEAWADAVATRPTPPRGVRRAHLCSSCMRSWAEG